MMRSGIRPIESRYSGYKFRSRLEARWAVFLNTLPLQWEYEREGFVLDGGIYYLPDFYLPQVCMWAEVKAQALTVEEMRRVRLLTAGTERACILLVGPPSCRPYDFVQAWTDDAGKVSWETFDCLLSNFHNYPRDEGRFYAHTGGMTETEVATLCDDIPLAVRAARSARFEHGEQP